MVLWVCGVSLTASAQLPIPLIPDWLKPGQGDAQLLSQTHVTLTGDNYTIVQQNLIGQSKGFKLLGLFSFRSASYTEAMSQLYSRARVENGRPQALANVLHEKTSSNFILFSIPRVRIRADLIEFTSEDKGGEEEMNDAAPTLLKKRM
jgi:hypothetical protein